MSFPYRFNMGAYRSPFCCSILLFIYLALPRIECKEKGESTKLNLEAPGNAVAKLFPIEKRAKRVSSEKNKPNFLGRDGRALPIEDIVVQL